MSIYFNENVKKNYGALKAKLMVLKMFENKFAITVLLWEISNAIFKFGSKISQLFKISLLFSCLPEELKAFTILNHPCKGSVSLGLEILPTTLYSECLKSYVVGPAHILFFLFCMVHSSVSVVVSLDCIY